MKKAYKNPEMEIIMFDNEDVITTSGGSGGQDVIEDGGEDD